MKPNSRSWLACLIFLMTASPLLAAEAAGNSISWKAQSLLEAILNMVIFVAVGLAAAVAGYKLFDKCTPGDMNREILEHRNVAAAIIGAAVILGVCLIVAAAMVG